MERDKQRIPLGKEKIVDERSKAAMKSIQHDHYVYSVVHAANELMKSKVASKGKPFTSDTGKLYGTWTQEEYDLYLEVEALNALD